MTLNPGLTLKPKAVLITGFPSMLARALIQFGLREDSKRRIYLFTEHAHKDQAQAFKQSLKRSEKRRLTILGGQSDAVELGLSGSVIKALTESVDLIFHANNIHALTKRASKKLRNLRHLIRIAHACKSLKRFCLFSSTSVNRHPTRIILEEELHRPKMDGTPSDILTRTELVVRELMPQLPCTIFRPSTMVGDSQTGDSVGLHEGIGRVLSNLIHSPAQIPVLIPQAREMPFNIVPIDFVVAATWSIACNPSSVSRTFHLTDPTPMRVEDAFALFSDLNNRQRPLFYGRVFARLIRTARRSVFRKLVPTFLVEQARGVIASSYDCSGTLDLLHHTEIRCPSFELYADTLATWLAHMERERLSASFTR